MTRWFPEDPMRLSSAAMSLLLAGGVAGCYSGANGTNAGSEESGSEGGSEAGDSGEGGAEDPETARITGIGVGGGPDELTYSGVDSLEQEAWGPAAYVVDHRGLNWLADGPGHKLLVIDDDGQIVDRYNLEGLVRGVEDIEVTETHVYVLMVGGNEPVIGRAGRNDVAPSAWETFSIPADNLDPRDVTGLRKDAEGVVSVELVFGREHLPLISADGNLIAAPGAPIGTYQVDGHSIALTGYTGQPGDDPSQGTLVVDGVEVASIHTLGMLGDLSLLGATPDGDVWLRVADVGMVDGAFVTQMFGHRYALDGTLVQVVQMPMREELVWVEHRITTDTEGELRVLSAGADEASLRSPALIGVPTAIELPPGVAPYLPGAETRAAAGANPIEEAPAPAPVAGEASCISRDEIMQRADEYATYTAAYNSNHMATCAGRTPVSYFQEHLGVLIQGVAYKYAGHIEVSTYDNAVQNNYTVGDLNTETDKNVDNCSYGVDCSGFVSKAWRSGHYTTSTLDNVSDIVESYEALRPGDALNKPGSHVRLVAEHIGTWGVKVVESTVGKDRMRVIVRDISWGEAGYEAGYRPIRYANICPDAPPPPPPTDTTHVVFDVSGYLPADSGYVPVEPTRLLDTRVTGHEHFGALVDGQVIEVTVAGHAGIPGADGIGAVVLDIIVAEPQGDGFLAAYPDGDYQGTSNINFAPNEATPGLVIIDPGTDGKITLNHHTTMGASHVVVDAFGYFPPAADIHMVTPARVFDSRQAAFGGMPVPAGARDVQLAGVGGIPLAGVGAVIANVAVVMPVSNGFATIYEAGTPQPVTSNLNYSAGTVSRANLVIVPVSESGLATLYTLQQADYIVDVLGWFGEGIDFEPIAPLRLLDTRIDTPGALGHMSSISIDVIGAPTIPDDVRAIFGNLTAVEPSRPGYLQVYANTEPSTSNVNFNAGMVVANAVLTEVSPAGDIHVRAVLP
jgi:hypothetical protein